MKLTINRTMKRKGHLLALLRAPSPSTFMRTIKEKGVFKKAAVYYLNVDLDVTREEMKLLKKNGAWEYKFVCSGHFHDRSWPNVNLGDIVGKRTRWGFKSLDSLEHFEGRLIDGLKEFKQTLKEATDEEQRQINEYAKLKQQAADFTPERPREIEL